MALSEILSYIIPLVAVLLSYLVGRMQNREAYKTKQLQLRYDSFYVPFIRKLYIEFLWAHSFANQQDEFRIALFSLIIDNIQYLGIKSQSYVPEIYVAHCGVLSYNEGDRDAAHTLFLYEQVMIDFTQEVLIEARELCRSLLLPDISRSFSERFLESTHSTPANKQESS